MFYLKSAEYLLDHQENSQSIRRVRVIDLLTDLLLLQEEALGDMYIYIEMFIYFLKSQIYLLVNQYLK